MARSEFVAGFRDVAVAAPSTAPLGMLYGATAVQVGIDLVPATALSVLAMAGIAQLTAVELLQSGASLPVVLATILLINARYVIYSASLAPLVRHLPRRWRAVIAYPLFDLNYALAWARFSDDDPGGGHKGWYYVGVSLPLVLVLVVSTVIGGLIGRAVGRGLQLDFAIPLLFLAVLASQIDDRRTALTGVAAAAVAVVGVGLPFNLGLLVATVCGTAVGVVVDGDRWRWWR